MALMNRRQAALEYLCARHHTIRLLFIGSLLGLALDLLSLLYTTPGSATHAVAILNLFGLVGLLLFSGGILYRCRTLLAV
jgi:hypothetical protein